jgi:hypothetical protein
MPVIEEDPYTAGATTVQASWKKRTYQMNEMAQ